MDVNNENVVEGQHSSWTVHQRSILYVLHDVLQELNDKSMEPRRVGHIAG